MAKECLRWRAVLGAAAQRQQRAFARALRNRWDKAAADKDSIDKAVWQAVEDGNEAELRRLIKLGGDVNMRDPVRRHMPCVVAACILTHGAPLFP